MQLVRNPTQYDMLLMPNLYVRVLSSWLLCEWLLGCIPPWLLLPCD